MQYWIYSEKVPPDHSGSGSRCIKHAEWLAKDKNRKVTIITTTRNPKPANGVSYITLKCKMGKGIFVQYLNLIIKYLQLRKHINSQKVIPHLFHSFGGGPNAFIFASICKSYKIPLICEVVVTLPPFSFSRKLNPNYWMCKFGLQKSDKVIAISEGVKKSIFDSKIKCIVDIIPNAVDINLFKPVNYKEKLLLRKKLGLPEKRTIILMVGRFCLRKGYDIGIKICSQMNRNILLVAVGPYDDKGLIEIKNRLTFKEIRYLYSDNVILKGQQINIEEYFQSCDIFLFPSRKEGFGNVLIEAMACKIPVVSSLLDGITNTIIKDQSTGFLISSEDPKVYIKAIHKYIENPTLISKITSRARNISIKNFSNQTIYDQYEFLYNRLLKNMPP